MGQDRCWAREEEVSRNREVVEGAALLFIHCGKKPPSLSKQALWEPPGRMLSRRGQA